MSDFSLTLVLQIKTSKIINDMAKVQLFRDIIAEFPQRFYPFWGLSMSKSNFIMLEDLFANPAPSEGRGANYLFPAFWTRPNGGVGLDETLQVRLLLVQFQPAAPAGDLVEAQLAVGGVEGGTP